VVEDEAKGCWRFERANTEETISSGARTAVGEPHPENRRRDRGCRPLDLSSSSGRLDDESSPMGTSRSCRRTRSGRE